MWRFIFQTPPKNYFYCNKRHFNFENKNLKTKKLNTEHKKNYNKKNIKQILMTSSEISAKITIYVLLLKNDKFYIGSTSNIKKRILEHFSGSGSLWTKMHPPIKVVETYEGDPFDEDKFLKKYSAQYGISNVRGGSYSNPILTSEQLNALQTELATSSGRCFNCGKEGHFSNKCPSLKRKIHLSSIKCYKCSQYGHYANACPN
jgi:predicted GIY-YIG superfamily endonuclease